MPLTKFLNNKQEQAPANAAGASSTYNPFAKLLEDNFMLNKKIQNETLDFLASETGLTNKPLQLDASKYAPYDVYINDINTEEELNKERANNQSALEQTGRMLGQMVGSEIILGSLRGFSDIVDALVNIPEIANGTNDFTNPVSDYLEGLQKDLRESLEIYRENPEAAWDITDYGWWTNNAVSIASTLSLMIPGGGYTYGLSLLGKAFNASKYLRKGLNIVSKHPNLRTKQLEGILNLGTHAGLMRTAEGYIESRDTYNTVHNEIFNRVSNMSNEERAKLDEYNPKFKGLSAEEIANIAAGESAVDTFKDDYWLMLLDAWQLKSLRNIGRGFKNINTTKTLREANKASIDRLIGRTPVKQSGIKSYLSDVDSNTLKTIGAELSEGFEEGYQYIQQQEGIDKGRKMIDPNYQARGYSDYLTDGHMWEQAFWGWMGGVAFQGIGSAANAVASKYIAKNEDILGKQRKAEIEGRIATLQKFITDVETLRQNKNPFNEIEGEHPDITDDERDALLEYSFEKLATDLTIEAAKKGNYDLLKEFLSSEEFQQYVDQSNVAKTNEERQYLNDIVQHMDEVYDVFEGEVNKVISNDVVNKGTIDRIATENTYLKLAARSNDAAIERYNKIINDVKSRITDDEIINQLNLGEKSYKLGMLNATIQQVKKQIADNDDNLKNKKINRAIHNSIKNDLTKYLFALYKETAPGIENEAQFNDYFRDKNNYNEQAVNSLEHIDRAAHEAIANKASNELQKVYYNYQINNTKDELQTRAKQIETEFAAFSDKMFQSTLAKLDNIYENNDIDEVLNYIYTKAPGNLTQEVRDAIDNAISNIKILDSSDENFVKQIVAKAEAKAKQKGARPVATVNGKPMNKTPEVAKNAAPAPDEENKKEKETKAKEEKSAMKSASPTGGQQQAVDKTQFYGYEDDEKYINRADSELRELNKGVTFDISNIVQDTNSIIISLNSDEDYKNADNDNRVIKVKEQLIEQGYSKQELDNENNLIHSMVKNDRRTRAMLKRSVENYDDIAYRILTNLEVDDNFFKEAIEQFKSENKVLTINGVSYFNIISFLKYVAKSDIITKFEDLREVRNRLLDYMRNTNDYKFDGTPVVKDSTLQGILANANLSVLEEDDRINILPKKDRADENLFQLAYQSIKPNDTLFYIANKNGIEFYKTVNVGNNKIDVKVAFNKFARSNATNNGFYVSIGKINYEVLNNNGNYGSTIDWLLDEIFKDNNNISQEAQDILGWILDPNTLNNQTFTAFQNNSLIKRLIKDHVTNKTITLPNAKDIINSLVNLYNYDTNGDYFDKRMSFINWFEKQYNNYKMTNALESKKDKRVTVKYISYGKAIASETENKIDETVVNFNLKDHHLGLVTNLSTIKDLEDGSNIAAPGFTSQDLVLIIPNGNNGKHYAKIEAQKIDFSKGFGKAIRDELFDIINRHISGEDTYKQTLDKVNSIFGYSNLVNDILVYENDGRIFFKDPNNNVPVITIYSKQKNKITDSTGIVVNLGVTMQDSVGIISLEQENVDLINSALDKILADVTYSKSFELGGFEPINNHYITKTGKQLTINIGGQTFNYENYLDFFVKNDAGRIKIGKKQLAPGIESNFETTNELVSKANIRIEPDLTPRRGSTNNADAARLNKIDEYINNGNIKSKSSNVLIKDIMPDYTELNILKQEGFISDKVEINITDEVKDDNGNLVRGEYTKSAKAKKGKITLYKAFFDDVKINQQNAMRILIHENIHRGISEIDNLFAQEDFIDELRIIRDTFREALTAGTERNNQARAYLEIIENIDIDATLNKFKNLIDNPNNTELYNLEEFLVESMTSSMIQGLLNSIDSTRNITVEKDSTKYSLWQRILDAIRKLFKFVDIKDNTLLAQEFELLGRKFNKNETSNTIVENVVDSQQSTINETKVEAKAIDNNYDNINFEDEDDDLFNNLSSINYDDVININSVTRRLTLSERAKFDASLDEGRIKMYCV